MTKKPEEIVQVLGDILEEDEGLTCHFIGVFDGPVTMHPRAGSRHKGIKTARILVTERDGSALVRVYVDSNGQITIQGIWPRHEKRVKDALKKRGFE